MKGPDAGDGGSEREAVPEARPALVIVSSAPEVSVSIPQAAADHLVAWTADQRTLAVHESGHVVVAAVLGLPLNAVTIKGSRGGHTESAVDDDGQPRLRTDTTLRRLIVALFGGLAAEQRILGEGTDGSDDDIAGATSLAMARLANGLDPEFPPISLGHFAYGSAPEVLLNLQGSRLVAELEGARAEAERLVAEHADQILHLAARLFAARRLDGEALDAALREVGITPPARGT